MNVRWQSCWLIALSLAYGAVMVLLGGTAYGWSPYHRLQADALLHGHLALGDAIEQMQPGLAWHNGHVQQVWGLGIGLWLTPFQAVWHLIGGLVFPDRIALGIAFALLAYFTLSTGFAIAGKYRAATGLGLVWLVLLCPPLWTLARASQLIFEETVLYALIVSLALIVSVIRVAMFASRGDYAFVCVLASLAGFVRPTHAVYGCCAVLVCSAVVYGKRKAAIEIGFGVFSLAIALALLGWTNQIRFGSPLEFGHRLAASSDSMVYLTRFGNPYAQTPLLDAAMELNGALFFNREVRDANAFSGNLFSTQAATTRWRRFYLTLFDPVHAAVCAISIVGLSVWLVCKLWITGLSRLGPNEPVAANLWVWSVGCVAVLAGFYLRFPIIASRYLLDFLPAIVGLVVTTWFPLSRRWPKASLAALAVWISYEIALGEIPATSLARSPAIEGNLPCGAGTALRQFGGIYSLSAFPSCTGLAHNGYGWDPENGFAEDIVVITVDDPEFVELSVSDRRVFNGEMGRPDEYRAMIDGRMLALQQVTRDGDKLRVLFYVPPELRIGEQYLCLCFSADYEREDRNSERFLYSVQWRRTVSGLEQKSGRIVKELPIQSSVLRE